MSPARPIHAAELPAVLPLALAAPGAHAPATLAATENFCDYLRVCDIGWEGAVVLDGSAPRGLVLALLLPGRTAVVLVSPPGELGQTAPAQRAALRLVLERLAARPLHYVQTLIEPEGPGKRTLFAEAGFCPLADLEYLERDARYPWLDGPDPSAQTFIRYSPETHARFAATVAATYVDSTDCPELTGLRPMDDVLASHRAAGKFDPRFWELVQIDGRDAGALLLAIMPNASALELVYVGVTPAFRGCGLGERLVRRALEQCRLTKFRQLTVVVDARNVAARRLYARLGFSMTAQRAAWWRRSSSPRPERAE